MARIAIASETLSSSAETQALERSLGLRKTNCSYLLSSAIWKPILKWLEPFLSSPVQIQEGRRKMAPARESYPRILLK